MKNLKKDSCLFPMPIIVHGLKSGRKASKCKKLIEQVLYRLKFLQARKSTIIAQTREDIVNLLQHGYFQRASNLVEELYKDKCRANAYEVINEICECISNNLTCIIQNRDIPMDLNVALSNLNFAASRCGELPELIKLRRIIRELHGKEFEACDVNLQPETPVKSELRTLCTGSISDEVKLELIKEITKGFSVVKCLPKECQQVYGSHEQKYEMELDQDGPRLGNKTEPVYKIKNTSEECNEIEIKEDVWPRKTSESMPHIQDSYYDSQAAELSLDSKGVGKRTKCTLCSDIEAYQPLPQSPSKKKNKKQMHLQKTIVGDSESRNQTEAPNNICLCNNIETNEDVQRSRRRALGPVHPKLPQYDDFKVKFKHPGARVRE